MPIYEYECRNCGYQCEKIQKVNEAPLLNCPACQKDSLVRLVSASAFRLKGNGWYETDFKTKKPAAEEKTTTPAAEKSEKSTSSGKTTASTAAE